MNSPCNRNLLTGTKVYGAFLQQVLNSAENCIDMFLEFCKTTFPISLFGSTTMEAMIKWTNIKEQFECAALHFVPVFASMWKRNMKFRNVFGSKSLELKSSIKLYRIFTVSLPDFLSFSGAA